MKQVELLAPGGDPLAVKAAVLAGADAVYLGVGDCNARKRAVNIKPEELAGLCRIAHDRSCRVYLALNTLVLEQEIPALITLLHAALAAGIDAVIVQDYGLLSVIHGVFPDLEIHASTQLATHNRGQLAFLARCGVKQVNFSRELSLAEIRELVRVAHQAGMRAEVFVHGAYCVSFSGQCYFSGLMQDNPANRGACVQPCRRAYTAASGTIRPLNLKDNALFARAAVLAEAGIDSFKIEGRIKGFDYVHAVVSAWREQLDRIMAGGSPGSSDLRLDAVFHRSFSDNLLAGTLGKDSFTAASGDDSLKEVAVVSGYHADSRELTLRTKEPLPAGLVLTIRHGTGGFVCTGTITESLGDNRYRFMIQHVLKGKITGGLRVFAQPLLAVNAGLRERLALLTMEETAVPLAMKLSGSPGSPLVLQAGAHGETVSVASTTVLETAASRQTDPATIRERLGKLGGTPYRLDSLDLSGLAENLFLPLQSLGALRREAVRLLMGVPAPVPQVPGIAAAPPVTAQRIAVVIRDLSLLAAIPRDKSVVACFRLPAAVADPPGMIAFFRENRDLVPWFPPILIGDQFSIAETILREAAPSSIVTDNAGIAALAGEMGIPWVAGSHLNATNAQALAMFQEQGAVGALPEAELGLGQLTAITIPEGMALWGPLLTPVLLMTSRHCLVRNCCDCGKETMDETCLPSCERDALIHDAEGRPILVVKNAGGYNTLYDSKLRWCPELIGCDRFSFLLLDLGVPRRTLMPGIAPAELIRLAVAAVCKKDRAALGELDRKLRPGSAPLPGGMGF